MRECILVRKMLGHQTKHTVTTAVVHSFFRVSHQRIYINTDVLKTSLEYQNIKNVETYPFWHLKHYRNICVLEMLKSKPLIVIHKTKCIRFM